MCAIDKNDLHDDDPNVVAGNSAISSGTHAVEGVGAENIAVGLNQSGFLSGSCPGNRQIDVLGQRVDVPLSDLCWFFEALGSALIALASIASVRIALGGGS